MKIARTKLVRVKSLNALLLVSKECICVYLLYGEWIIKLGRSWI